MHKAAYEYIERAIVALPVTGRRVVEIGAYNVNGSVAPLFIHAAEYVGVDIRPGPGVQVVVEPGQALAQAIEAHTLLGFDVCVTTETIEHAADPEQMLRDAWEVLRPGGLLLLTGAAPERQPHGCDGGSVVPPDEHYQNIDPAQLREWLRDWTDVEVEHDPAAGDVYARAVKPAQKAAPRRRRTQTEEPQP